VSPARRGSQYGEDIYGEAIFGAGRTQSSLVGAAAALSLDIDAFYNLHVVTCHMCC
jgi:hypothetical protein